ncbi:MAG: T9SS type A sorting domain-containing protein, partial [Bacteroidota bacterium]
QIILSWEIEDININEILIERLDQDHRFSTLKRITLTHSEKTFLDEEPLGGYNYYRLTSIKDNETERTEIVSVYMETDADVTFYPNPNNGTALFIETPATDRSFTVLIYDKLGAKLKRTLKNEDIASTNLLRQKTLEPGIYYINVQKGANSFTKRLVVKR